MCQESSRLLQPDGSSSSGDRAIGFLEALNIPVRLVIILIFQEETKSKFQTKLSLLFQGVIEFSMSLFFSKLVSYTFLYWLPKYIKHSSECNIGVATLLYAWLRNFQLLNLTHFCSSNFISD